MIIDAFDGKKTGKVKGPKIKDLSRVMLFDMEQDPRETVNLIQQNPEIAKALQQELADVIQAGRSTPGALKENDPLRKGEKWKQLDGLRTYMTKDQ